MAAPKKVLVSNDDGIAADGLLAITRALVNAGYDVRVAAPARQQSGVSHCLSLFSPVTVESYTLPSPLEKVIAFKIDGTPADCVKLAITALCKDWKPDILVSGINFGLNCGRSVIYSGTVAAAMEGCVNGIPAVAMSLDFGTEPLSMAKVNPSYLQWESASHFGCRVVQTALANPLPEGSWVNVNFPNLPVDKVRGVKLTKQGVSTYQEYFAEVKPKAQAAGSEEAAAATAAASTPTHDTRVVPSASEGAAASAGQKKAYRLKGTYAVLDKSSEFDGKAVEEGYVSVTPMGLNLHTEYFADICKHFRSWKLFQEVEASS